MAISLPLPFLQARRAKGSLVIAGVDILAGLGAQNITSFSYTDSTSDKADDLTIDIADPQRIWMLNYIPKKGLEAEASILIYDWASPGDTRTLRCGTFYVDQARISGPPNKVSIKATSIPINTGIKSEKKTKAWEAFDLKSIAQEIASNNQLTLFYDTQVNPTVKRTDQVEKPDIEYLRDRAKEASLSIKIHDRKLVIYSEKEYDQKEAAFTLVYGASNILSYDFVSKCDDTYDKAENSYLNPETGKLNKTTFEPETKPEGVKSTLKLNERVEYDKDGFASYGMQGSRSYADNPNFVDWKLNEPAQNAGKGEGGQEASERKCKSKLREKNKKEKQSSITLIGNISFLSGICFETKGFGIFDTKWFIESSIHSVSDDGYTTQLKLRGSLVGY